MTMNDMPYAMRLLLAQMARDGEAASRTVMECFESVTDKLLLVVREYDSVDLPFVIAAMKITADALMPILNDSGRSLVNNLCSHTQSITVDLQEAARQAGEEKHDGGEKEH